MALLERESQLSQLEAHLRHVDAGHGRVVFVGGEAGVGKTSLVDEFCRRARGAAQVLWKSCDALSTPGPLGSLRDAAPELGLRIDPDCTGREGRDRLFRATLSALAARPGTTIMVGEDAHWADGATLELVRFLARRIGDIHLLLIVTYRDDELGTTHTLRRLLGDLATAATVHRLPVPPLSSAAVGTLAEGSGRDPGALHQLTAGNPFFVTEVLATEGDVVPASVEDAILARAARLSPEARSLLDVSAVIASTIYPDLLRTVAGPVLERADDCVERGLLRATDHGLVFRHELTRKAVLAAISPPRRQLLHARVLAALRQDPEQARDLALLAHHAEEAGDREAVLEFAIPAASQAAALHAHREAAAQYARALRFADRLSPSERAELLEGQSIALYLSDHGEEAVTARQTALGIWRDLGDRRKEGESLRWLARLYWIQGQGTAAEESAIAALNVLEALPPGPELAMAYSTLSQLRMLANDLAESLLWGQRAIALAEDLGESETLIHALANVGTAWQTAGDDRGEEALRRSLQLALDGGYPDHACRALTNLAWGAMREMRLAEAERRLATVIAYATEHDLESYRGYAVATRAAVRVRQGDWDTAETEIHQLLRQPLLSINARIVAHTSLGQVQTRRGNRAAASAAFDTALALAESTGELMRLEPVRAARAEFALLHGDLALARQEARAISDLAFSRGDRWQRGQIAWLLWRAGDQEIPTDLITIAEPFALQIAGQPAAAASIWQSLGCPYEAARALAESDDVDSLLGAVATFEHLGAKPALARAIRRLRSLGVHGVPRRRRGRGAATAANPAGLTQREAEVLSLVTAGLRNAEIAERLYLTPKTVSHHLTTIYAKLGVTSRTEAVRAASGLGISPT